jgi:hypothetical protein
MCSKSTSASCSRVSSSPATFASLSCRTCSSLQHRKRRAAVGQPDNQQTHQRATIPLTGSVRNTKNLRIRHKVRCAHLGINVERGGRRRMPREQQPNRVTPAAVALAPPCAASPAAVRRAAAIYSR